MSDPSINVETSELSRFATDVRFEADEALQPMVSRTAVSLPGASFGQGNASGTVHAAKARYEEALLRAKRNLDEYVKAGQIMSAAAELAAKEFDAVDGRSAEAVTRINQMLRTAYNETQRVALEAAYGPGGPGASAI